MISSFSIARDDRPTTGTGFKTITIKLLLNGNQIKFDKTKKTSDVVGWVSIQIRIYSESFYQCRFYLHRL